MKAQLLKARKAFTLIELLVGIAIIGILATLAIVSLQQARSNARDAKRIADVRQMQLALELYYHDNGFYPDLDQWSSGQIASINNNKIFMQEIPRAPAVLDGDCQQGDYLYTPTDNQAAYVIQFCTGKQISDLPPGNLCATPGGISPCDPINIATCTPSCGINESCVEDVCVTKSFNLVHLEGRSSTAMLSSIDSSFNGTTVLAGSEIGYVYISHDSGQSWSEISSLGFARWGQVAVSDDASVLTAVSNGGIYISTDGGVNWQNREPLSASWNNIAASANGSILVAAEYDGYIYTSNDLGLNWVPRIDAGSRKWADIAISSDGMKIVAVSGGNQIDNGYIYTSNDSGVSWVERTSAGFRRWQSVGSSLDGTKLAAIAWGSYVYTSDDSGVTWVERTGSGLRNWSVIESSPDGVNLFAGIGLGSVDYVYQSSDSGLTWTSVNDLSIRNWTVLHISNDSSKFFAAPESGYLYSSSDLALNWTEIDTIGPKILYSTISFNGVKAATIVNDGYIYTSSDSGLTWAQRDPAGGPRGWSSIASSDDGSHIIAAVNSVYDGYIYTSNDSGLTWTQRDPAGGAKNWNVVASSADGSRLVAAIGLYSGEGRYIYTSDDFGQSWVERSSAGSRRWNSLASSADGLKLIAGDNGGYVYTSDDAGQSWVQRDPAGAVSGWSSVSSSADGNTLFALSYNGLYMSNNAGINWLALPSSSEYHSIDSSSDGSIIALAGDAYGSVIVSEDNGANWLTYNFIDYESQYIPTYSVSVSGDASKIMLGAYNDGIWVLE